MPSTVTSSSAAFGRCAFGIGQPRRDRRGRTDIVKGRSVRSGGNVLTTLSCSASGIFAICCDLTRPTIMRLARTCQSTRTRRCREQYMPLVALCLRHFWADFIICMCVFDFRQAQAERSGLLKEKSSRIAGRVSPALVEEAKRRTGIEADTDLIAFALANLALQDNFAQAFKDARGKVDADLKLGF